MNFDKQLYINGELVQCESSTEIINPATQKAIGTVQSGGIKEAKAALDAANSAFPFWSNSSIEYRVEWMQRLRNAIADREEHLRDCIHMEMGKSWASTLDDFSMLLHCLDFYATEIQRKLPQKIADPDGAYNHSIKSVPIGVTAAFLAWNFPLLNLAYKLGPAMAAGCPIVVKPSLKTPLSACAVGQICSEIDLPPGVVNIVCGDDKVLGDEISSSTIPALVTLIGSTATGRHVMKTGATSIKRYSMELGGNAPVLIFEDADLDLAADIICSLKFSNAGQICVAPNRIYVDAKVENTLIDKIVERTKLIKVGFDKTADIDMGPVIDEAAWNRIDELVKDAISNGAEMLLGGGRPENMSSGYFYAPTILTGVNAAMKIYREEVFGPVVSISRFRDEEEVIAKANATDAGLSSFIFSHDPERIERCANQLNFGEVHVNGVKYAVDLPHCGLKQSGVGVDCSYLALDDYFAVKRISQALI
ncbi:NAD-dependent succinate-semialdehyde dehydrogenase [Agarilytica rhodophyticola]|uniref:NAD-dependent succinate-semialdehyde dehydrogenase n=1 Tax=Agarilytica rhodophyticola TaxID=1737490 RepID=UPI000B342CD5|nr:NAD-dependent succinate-semialdehyde dehydrogenase [Agarilytica rhodophyticola]